MLVMQSLALQIRFGVRQSSLCPIMHGMHILQDLPDIEARACRGQGSALQLLCDAQH